MLDNVLVDAYGATMKIRDLATISSPEPRQILVSPYDPSTKDAIAKGIEKGNIGIRPIVDGNVVRLNVPPMDESMRKEMVKICHKEREKAKVSIRNIRRDSNEIVRKQKGEGEIPEDLMKKIEKEIQDLTDKFCKIADDVSAVKEKEITHI
jgi:ribosome recycling factor